MPLRAEFRAFSTLPRDLSSVKFGILNSHSPLAIDSDFGYLILGEKEIIQILKLLALN